LLLAVLLLILLIASLVYVNSLNSVPKADTIPPQPPQELLNTTYPTQSGVVHTVAAGGDLQAVINAANPGDTIRLTASATFTGNFTLPEKAVSDKWIIIRSDVDDSWLPSPGIRIAPWDDRELLARIISPNASPALRTASRAARYRIMGVDISLAEGVESNNGLVLLGDGSNLQNNLSLVPKDIILDRVFVHGSQTANVRFCIGLHSARTAIIDSVINDCTASSGSSQALNAWNGPGPYKLVNNHFTGIGRTVALGGTAASIPNLITADIEFRNNLVAALDWTPSTSSAEDKLTIPRSTFEMSNVRRVLIDGNVFDNNWVGNPLTTTIILNGGALLDGDVEQGIPAGVLEDISFVNNLVTSESSSLGIYGSMVYSKDSIAQRIRINNNFFNNSRVNTPHTESFLNIFGASSVTVSHNTIRKEGSLIFTGMYPTTGFEYKNNINVKNTGVETKDIPPGAAVISNYLPASLFAGNVIVGGNTETYSANNFYPATDEEIGFEPYGDSLSSTSPYKGKATDNTNPGADFSILDNIEFRAIFGIGNDFALPVVEALCLNVDTEPPQEAFQNAKLAIIDSNNSVLAQTSESYIFDRIVYFHDAAFAQKLHDLSQEILVIKVDGYVARITKNPGKVTNEICTDNPTVTLRAGDYNNNDEIDLSDIARIIALRRNGIKDDLFPQGVQLSDIAKIIRFRITTPVIKIAL
jgi:hypothetical protein